MLQFYMTKLNDKINDSYEDSYEEGEINLNNFPAVNDFMNLNSEYVKDNNPIANDKIKGVSNNNNSLNLNTKSTNNNNKGSMNFNLESTLIKAKEAMDKNLSLTKQGNYLKII